jgi:hypothetical protein
VNENEEEIAAMARRLAFADGHVDVEMEVFVHRYGPSAVPFLVRTPHGTVWRASDYLIRPLWWAYREMAIRMVRDEA